MAMAKTQRAALKRTKFSPSIENWECDVSVVAPGLARAVFIRQAVDYFHAAGYYEIRARLKQEHLPRFADAPPAKLVDGELSHRPDITAEFRTKRVYFDVVLPEYVYQAHFPDRWQAWANAREFRGSEVWFGVPDNATAMRLRDRWDQRINTNRQPNRILVLGGDN
jgi:hypothetical protein